MVMSYFGRVAERCRRASYCFISLADTRTPSGYAPWRRFTVGCWPFQVIRRAHCRTTFRQVSNTPFVYFTIPRHPSFWAFSLAFLGKESHERNQRKKTVRHDGFLYKPSER